MAPREATDLMIVVLRRKMEGQGVIERRSGSVEGLCLGSDLIRGRTDKN